MTFSNKLPNFFIIGVVKGGTTSLYNYLSQHPDIYLPPIKETNHFSKSDIRKEDFLKTYSLDVEIDLDKYIRLGMKEVVHIAHVNNEEHYKALFSKVENQRAIGEISNSYMICPSSASSIFEFNPSAKIIVMLRNPIQRAWSQYLMNIREAKSCHESFIQELKSDDSCEKKGWGVNHQYLELGKYAEQLQRYVDLFGREQILVLFHEDYKEDTAGTMSEICSFLEIDASFQFDTSQKSNISSLPRFGFLNKVLIESGILQGLKKQVPRSLRRKFNTLLYTSKDLPKLSPDQKDWLRTYYMKEVNALTSFLSYDVTDKWIEFK